MSEKMGIGEENQCKILFSPKYIAKASALSSRFFESLTDNPQTLPLDLCCGVRAFGRPSAFHTAATTLVDPYFSKVSAVPSPFVALKHELERVKSELRTFQKKNIFMDVSPRRPNAFQQSATGTPPKQYLSGLIEKLICIQKDVFAQKQSLDHAESKLTRWAVDITVQSAQYNRRLEADYIVSKLTSLFGAVSLHKFRRIPAIFHEYLKRGSCIKPPKNSLFKLPPHIVSLMNKFEITNIQRSPSNLELGFDIASDILPPVCRTISTRCLSDVDPHTSELALVRYLWRTQTSNKDKIELRQRCSDVIEKLRSSWMMLGVLTQRYRQLCDQDTSMYGYFPILRKEYPIRLLNLLGKGGFAQVWEGIEIETLQHRAIKIIELSSTLSKENQEFILASTFREVTLQRTLKHPNVVEMLQCFEITPSIFVASLDLCDGGTLDEYIQRYGPIREQQARLWIFQILLALEYIHSTGKVVHFDIKPTNIMIHQKQIKISDFGLHQPVGTRGKAAMDMTDDQNRIGTIWYMPPEHLHATLLQTTSVFDARFDIWSAGVVFYEMLYQRRPYASCTPVKEASYFHIAAALYADIMHKGLCFDKPTNEVSDACKIFIQKLLQPIKSRVNAAQALRDPYLEGLQLEHTT